MNSFTQFAGDPKVHDTVLVTMIITSLLQAVRRFAKIDNTPIAPGIWAFIKLVWNFVYDWTVGFWSMKTGQPPVHPLELHTQSSEQTPTSLKTQSMTLAGSEANPMTPETPAKP